MSKIKNAKCEEAVLIAGPHYLRPDLAMESLRRGLHVMIELPVGVYTKQVREMNEVAKEARSGFSLVAPHRANGLFKKMYDIVQNGELGKIIRTNWTISQDMKSHTWKSDGGGILINECAHLLDLWQWICGMPCKVTAFCHEGKWHDIEVEDDVTAYVEYPGGATGVFSASDMHGPNRLEVMGESGRLVYEDSKLKLFKAQGYRAKIIKPDEGPTTDGQMPVPISGSEGINSLMLSNAMYLSSWLGKTISLPLDEELFLAELRKKF